MKGKIKNIPLVKSWDGANGTVYFHTLELEDGKEIQLGKKTDNAFTIGQEIDYESYMKDGKEKFKEVREQFTPGGSREEDPYRQMMILAQSSTHRAVELINAGLLLKDGKPYGLSQMESLIGRLMDIQIKLAKDRL